mmetsp:Transcript_51127/g.94630  ORF Transcript_51127/g.94630 Transcript_51127/m.94630 type:complete len:269 (+) Transcript_51127:50-856(+)
MSSNGWSDLHRATQSNDAELMKRLIGSKASMNAKDIFEYTPLHHAVEYGHRTAMQVLLDYSANVNSTDMAGRTPLHTAAFSGRVPLVECLLSNGADVNLRDSYNFQTPLELARASAHDAAATMIENAELGLPLGYRPGPKGCLGFFIRRKPPAAAGGRGRAQSSSLPQEVRANPQLASDSAYGRDELDSLPDESSGGEGTCSICLGKLPGPDASVPEKRRLYKTLCGHSFHEGCLQSWCDRAPQAQCPLCKACLDVAEPQLDGANEHR